MSNLVSFAEDELKRAGMFDKDSDYGGMLGDAVLNLVKSFASAGHSGYSAAMTTELFGRLARYQPITPLTGEDDEWVDMTAYSDGPMWQNKRDPSVFKDDKGAWDVDAPGERVNITFPYLKP